MENQLAIEKRVENRVRETLERIFENSSKLMLENRDGDRLYLEKNTAVIQKCGHKCVFVPPRTGISVFSKSQFFKIMPAEPVPVEDVPKRCFRDLVGQTIAATEFKGSIYLRDQSCRTYKMVVLNDNGEETTIDVAILPVQKEGWE